MKDYYIAERVTEKVWAIKSLGGEFVYLVVGQKEALLIDTCVGVGNLKHLISDLTTLPLTVALSHGHIDHAMGSGEFDNVYLNPLDIPVYQSMCDKEDRMGYLRATVGDEAAETLRSSMIEAKPDFPFLPLEDGQVFDLGGIHVFAHSFPGHTPGMMAFLIEEEKILILGDACNNSTFLFDHFSTDVETYQRAVRETQHQLQGRFHRIFISHHEMDVDTDIMENMLDVCDDILSDKADDLPFEFMGMTAYIAKECDQRFHRIDGKAGNLVYNKEKVFVKER